MSIIAVILFNIGVLFTFRHYIVNKMQDYKTDEKLSKQIKLYSIIMLIIVLLISIGRSIVYSNANIFTELKIIALLSIMWPIAIIDQKQYKIPNEFICLALLFRVIILAFEVLTYSSFPLMIVVSELIAAFVMLISTMLCRLAIKDSIGYGDIKLFMVMGLFIGIQKLWTVMFFVLISIFVVCLYLLITKKANRKDVVPFGPSIVLGTFLAVVLF